VSEVALPGFLEPLPDGDEMRATDRWAIEERGVPGLELMERAGAGLADLVTEVAPRGVVAIVCGAGNNGGDGYVAARLLREAGREVRVATTVALDKLRGDARANLDRLPEEPPAPFAPGVLDAAAEAVAALNAAEVLVVAADVPSGVDATTGAVAGKAVRAFATATFHQAKPGLWVAPGKQHAGTVRVIDIGMPPGAPVRPLTGLLTPRVLDLLPRRGPGSTKFSSGHVLVVGGSTGLTGAPCLAAEGAMRAGAGYVTACVPASLNAVFEVRLLEVMTKPLPDVDGALTETGSETVLAESGRRGGAMVVGPGIGRGAGAVALARAVVAGRGDVAVVLDADGLNAHAGAIAGLEGCVLTPHAGELGRLLEVESAAVNAERLRHAREAAGRSGAVVVLKGDDTIVTEPGGRTAISPGGAPALATAGTGDVLSGVIAAALAQGLAPFEAACAGVRLHLEAGRRAAAERVAERVIARDVIEQLALVG
jgi:ADP-dependent NAD(P)H-hydrate dehydratase / NAD(P)H-hydrate epimerase